MQLPHTSISWVETLHQARDKALIIVINLSQNYFVVDLAQQLNI